MSRNRTIPRERRIASTKGPDGRRYCRWCNQSVKPPRRTFCSDACVHEWRLRSDPEYLRHHVFRRDRGVCAACGLDTEALVRKVRRAKYDCDWPWARREQVMQRLQELGVELPGELPLHRESLWDADHIVPVAEGGGECDLSNIQTLCVWCHARKTAEQNRRRKGVSA